MAKCIGKLYNLNSFYYRLKQAQYAEIYQASERTIRNWMKVGAPLDDPHACWHVRARNKELRLVCGIVSQAGKDALEYGYDDAG